MHETTRPAGGGNRAAGSGVVDRVDPASLRTSVKPGAMLVGASVAAELLSISPRLLWTLTDRGEIPRIRIGRAVRYDPRDLEAWVNKKRTAGPGAGIGAKVPAAG